MDPKPLNVVTFKLVHTCAASCCLHAVSDYVQGRGKICSIRGTWHCVFWLICAEYLLNSNLEGFKYYGNKNKCYLFNTNNFSKRDILQISTISRSCDRPFKSPIFVSSARSSFTKELLILIESFVQETKMWTLVLTFRIELSRKCFQDPIEHRVLFFVARHTILAACEFDNANESIETSNKLSLYQDQYLPTSDERNI